MNMEKSSSISEKCLNLSDHVRKKGLKISLINVNISLKQIR